MASYRSRLQKTRILIADCHCECSNQNMRKQCEGKLCESRKKLVAHVFPHQDNSAPVLLYSIVHVSFAKSLRDYARMSYNFLQVKFPSDSSIARKAFFHSSSSSSSSSSSFPRSFRNFLTFAQGRLRCYINIHKLER